VVAAARGHFREIGVEGYNREAICFRVIPNRAIVGFVEPENPDMT
jgi:hypothetical protein